ncbi:hypothetical protein ANN_17680 [Periplaneta americana]|uniref:DUF659 domain-containing protein n=1 Tax=Periplaneta americana TaxID=6978 RepID=A0ABQ8SVR3_PERAM|nr:hypothetical protein ANN_17680 [Periplaneta americana]
MVERYIKTVEEHLRKVVSNHQRDWDARVPLFLFAYRASVHDTTGMTPANMVFGRELRLPCDLLFGTPPSADQAPQDGQRQDESALRQISQLCGILGGRPGVAVSTNQDQRKVTEAAACLGWTLPRANPDQGRGVPHPATTQREDDGGVPGPTSGLPRDCPGRTALRREQSGTRLEVRHPELAAAGENVSGKQQRCISSAIASNKGVLDQTQADFHPRGRISDSSSGSTVSALVVGNMRLVEHQVDGDTDLMINGVGFDIAVEQSSVKYRSRMGEEKYVKKASASRTIVDNCVVNMAKNHLVMSENNNCQHSNGEECESDSSEELQYGPGIVNKLKCRYMSMTLRENQNKGLRPSLSNMRRATSLENMLDNDSDAGKPQITQHRFTKRTDATNNSTKAEHTSQHQQRYRPTSRRNDSMKRARSVETLLRYDPKSHTATGHSIPSDLPICDRVVKSEFRDCNKNTTKLLKALGNEEIVIVENKMKVECSRKSVGEEKLPMFQQKKRTTNIPEETELPPPDVVKQTLKIFEGTPTRKSSRLARTPGVTSKSAAYKHSSASLVKVNNSGNDNGTLSAKPLLSPKPVLSPEKNVLSNQSPRKLQLSTDGQHTTSTPTLNTRVLTLDTVSSPFLSPVVSPTGTSRLKSPSPTDFPRLSPIATEDSVKDVTTSLTNGKITPQNLIAEEKSSSSEDEDDSMDGATKTVSSSALDNIRKDGTSMEFKFSSSSLSMAPKSYLPGRKNYLPTGNTTIPSKVFNRNQKVTSPVLERQDFVTKSTSAPPVSKSPDSPQIQMKQVGVIRPIVNNAHPTSPPPSLTNREIEKNFINRTKSIEQPTSRVVVSLKPADDVVVGKVSMESVRGRLDDSVKSARDSVTLRSISDSKSSGLWDKKPWNQPQNTMVFDFSGRKGPVPSYIENDGMVRPRTKISCRNTLENPSQMSRQLEKIILNHVTTKLLMSYEQNWTEKIWVSIDETTDCMGRYVVNVIVGDMNEDNSGDIFLFYKSINYLWPSGVQHDSVLLFLTDAAPYMVKAANSLKVLYSKMVHVTCLAHACHRIAEEIRGNFPDVDKLIGNVKKVFLKSPSRVNIFQSEANGIPLPPAPILTG